MRIFGGTESARLLSTLILEGESSSFCLYDEQQGKRLEPQRTLGSQLVNDSELVLMKAEYYLLLDHYRKKYPQNQKGVLESHIDRLIEQGRTREEAERELMKQLGII